VVRPAQNVLPSTTVGSLTNGAPPSVAKGCGRICQTVLKIVLAVLCIVLLLLAQAEVTIERPPLGLTVGAIAQMAGVPTGAQAPARALVISAQRSDLSAEESGRLAAGLPVPGVTVVRSTRDVAPSSTVGSLTNGEPAPLVKYFHYECELYPGSIYCCNPIFVVWRPTG
jgi:hypothetical protein